MRLLQVMVCLTLPASMAACDDTRSKTEANVARVDLNAAADAAIADINEAAAEALAAADAALANAGEVTDEAGPSGDTTPTYSSPSPGYSTTAYCAEIGRTAGGSYMIEKACRDQEMEARQKIMSRTIPERIRRYCNEIGQTAGGSYMIYNACVDQELGAAAAL